MILPTKGISAQRALLTMGAQIIEDIDSPMSVSTLWEKFKGRTNEAEPPLNIGFDWFSLAITALYTLGTLEMTDDGRIRKMHVS